MLFRSPRARPTSVTALGCPSPKNRERKTNTCWTLSLERIASSVSLPVATIRNLGGVAVVPHPFQRTRHGIRKGRIEDCDAIEVYNAWIFTGYRNRRARQFAARNDYPGVAASDAHSARYLGRAYTELTVEASSKAAEIGRAHV